MDQGKSFLPIFFRQLLRYLSVAVILIVSCFFLVWQTYQNARQAQILSAQANLEKGLAIFSGQAARAQTIAGNLQQNEYFMKVTLIKGEPRPDELIYLKKVQDLIKQYILSSQVDEDMFLLFRENSCLVTMNLCSDQLSSFYPALFSYGGMDAEAFRAAAFENAAGLRYLGTQPIYSHYSSGKTYTGLTALVNVMPYTTSRPVCVLGIITRQEVFVNGFLEADQKAGGFLRVTAPDGSTLLSYGYEKGMERDTGRYVVISKASDAGLTAMVGIPARYILNNIRATVQSAILITVLSVLAAMLAALILSIRMARALKPIIDTAYKQTHRRFSKQNEYGYIGDALRLMGVQNAEQARRIQALRSSALTCAVENLLIMGVYSKREEKEAAALLDQDFDAFQVMQLRYDCEDAKSETQLLLFVEQQLNSLGHQKQVLMLNTRSRETTLLLFSPDDSLLQASKELIACAHGALPDQPAIHIGLSRAASGIRQVRKAYLEANYVLYMNCVGGISGAWRYECSPQSEEQFDFSLLLKLNDLILRGDTGGVSTLLQEVILPPALASQPEAVKMQRFYLLRQMLQNIEQSMQSGGEEASLLPVYQAGVDISVQLEALSQSALALCAMVSDRQHKGNLELKQKVEQYALDHAFDPGLNAAMIAQAFMISDKYVFALIKEQTGKSLGSFLEDVRLNEAERLLSQTSYSNAAIWQQCGFGSENTFYRAFSKRRGVSPSLWRKNQGKI